MKPTLLLLMVVLLHTTCLLRQTDCQSILANARSAAAKGNYKEAIDGYNALVDCDPNLSSTANNEIKAMFDKADLFYGKFAIAFKNKQFYFINKNGEAISKLGEWDNVRPFDRNGFAKTEKDNKKYLLDTLGNTYPVAYSLNDLSHDIITALYFSDQKLQTLPDSVCRHTQLKILLLNNNQLITLPESISKLTNLQTLDLWGNYALYPYDEELEGEELKIFLSKLSKGEITFGK